MNRPVLIGIVLFLLALGGLLLILNRPQPQKTAPPPATSSRNVSTQTAPAPTETAHLERRINVLLFFNQKDSTNLVTEDRFVPYKETLRDQAFEVIKEMVKGSKNELVSTLPEGTQVRELFVTPDGTAYVDFSPEIATKHIGGSMAEINTVYAIVNTLTLNFPQIKRVQILVDDRSADTLSGHLDLSRPFTQDLSMVAQKN